MRSARLPFQLRRWDREIAQLAELMRTTPEWDAAHRVLILRSGARNLSPGLLYEVELYCLQHRPQMCLNVVTPSTSSFHATGLRPLTKAQLLRARWLAEKPASRMVCPSKAGQ